MQERHTDLLLEARDLALKSPRRHGNFLVSRELGKPKGISVLVLHLLSGQRHALTSALLSPQHDEPRDLMGGSHRHVTALLPASARLPLAAGARIQVALL